MVAYKIMMQAASELPVIPKRATSPLPKDN
jgi:hypothetical protein